MGTETRGCFELGAGMKRGDGHSQDDLSWIDAC